MKKHFRFFTVAALCMLAVSTAAYGCACCEETGAYSIWTGKPDTYHLGVLKDIKLESNAALYMTEAGFDGIKGLDAIRKEYESDSWTESSGDFSLINTFSNRVWRFQLKTKSGKTGAITLPMPAKMLTFKVDIHDNSDKGLGPLLYKEFRFQGTVGSGTGFFKADIDPATTYFLVFQGRGNGCDNASDFTHWRLEITGKKASYAFFGTTGSEQKTKPEARLSILQ
jgi:hypothetical protein